MSDKPYKCEVCGREMSGKKKVKSNGHIYCTKHYNQIMKYGHPLDTNPRTSFDRNEFHIKGKKTFIDLYDKEQNVIAQAIIDTEDLYKVRNIKWKLSKNGYAMNTPKKGKNKHMSRVILGVDDQFVDHINHNTLDNRKKNLRVVTKSQNQMNSLYKGVCERSDERYMAHIKIDGKMINLGTYYFEEEAYYARWYAEKLLFGEYRYKKPRPDIPDEVAKEVRKFVKEKLQRL